MEVRKQEFFCKDRVWVKVDYDCKVECEVTEVRNEFGRIRYTVKPIAGVGEMKIEKVERIIRDR